MGFLSAQWLSEFHAKLHLDREWRLLYYGEALNHRHSGGFIAGQLAGARLLHKRFDRYGQLHAVAPTRS